MVRLFFSLPPAAYFIFAVILLGLGYTLDASDKATQAERAQALEGEMPKVVDLGDYTPSDSDLAKEVHVAAQFNQDHTYILWKDSSSDSNAHVVYMLFDPAATEQDKVVEAALVVKESIDDQVYEWMLDNMHGEGALSPVFHMNGTRSSTTTYGDIASDAITDNGFSKAPDFFYLKPFVSGRAAGLAPRTGGLSMLALGAVLALIVAAIGGIKMMMRRRTAR